MAPQANEERSHVKHRGAAAPTREPDVERIDRRDDPTSENEKENVATLARHEFRDMNECKTAIARSLGLSRSFLYYKPKARISRQYHKRSDSQALNEHPAYGYRRVALHLKINKKRTQRVIRKYGIRPRIMRRKSRYGGKKSSSGVPNRIAGISPIASNIVWAGDFTYLWYAGRYLYLATAIDTFTPEVIGWQLGMHHTTRLVLDVLEEAVRKRLTTPHIFHSDQGSEYASLVCVEWLVRHHILPSHSPKREPWHNGRQASFLNSFKLEFGKTNQYTTVEGLIEPIGCYINYYNSSRIHSALKMPPRAYCLQELQKGENPTSGGV